MIETAFCGDFSEMELDEMRLRFRVQEFLHKQKIPYPDSGELPDEVIELTDRGRIMHLEVTKGSLSRLEIGDTQRMRYSDGSFAPKYAVEFCSPGSDRTKVKAHRNKRFMQIAESTELPNDDGEELWVYQNDYSVRLLEIISDCLTNGNLGEAEPFNVSAWRRKKIEIGAKADRLTTRLSRARNQTYGYLATKHVSLICGNNTPVSKPNRFKLGVPTFTNWLVRGRL